MKVENRLNRGEICFLKLDGFDPAWRQAVVVQTNLRGARLYLACRVLEQETEELESEFTCFDAKGVTFLLVEGRSGQTRPTCQWTHRALEVDPKIILERAKDVLESADLHYVTASEDLDGKTDTQRAKRQEILEEKAESSSNSDEGEEDDVMTMLLKAQRLTHAGATSSEPPKKSEEQKTGRYPMLDKKKKEKNLSGDGLEQILRRSLAGGSTDLPSPAPDQSLNTLVVLELLKAVKRNKRSKSALNSAAEDRDSELDSTDSSADCSRGKARGAGRALKDFRSGHKRMKQNPLRHVRRYIREIEEYMGVGPEVAYNISDFTKRVQWGKQKGLMRTHFAISEMLQTMLRGKHDLAALQAVQILRALYQCNLDGGSWKAASLLLSHPDPLERVRFGGEASQLEDIASYLKAMQELEKRTSTAADRQDEDGGKGKKGKGKKTDSQTES